MKDKKTLIRVVIDNTPHKGKDFVIDSSGKSPGRGAYLCRDISCISNAKKAKGLERSLKCGGSSEIYSKLTAEVER